MTRAWVQVGYPGKTSLSRSEAMNVLRHGPEPEWLEPVYRPIVIIADGAGGPTSYGMVLIYGGDGEPDEYDVQMFISKDELSWALESQWNGTARRPDEPRRPYDVYYFTPDGPIHFEGSVEEDDEVTE